MAYVISDDCIACGTCMSECPSDAISEGDIYKTTPTNALIAVLVPMLAPLVLSTRVNNPQQKKIKSPDKTGLFL